MDRDGSDDLQVADWRRRVATLYAEVRRLAATDPVAAVQQWRTEREQLYRLHPQSPLPAGARATFQARHFPYDPALRCEAPVLLDDEARPTALPDTAVPTSIGGSMTMRRIGRVDVPFPQGLRRLAVYWMEGYAGGLFLSFRDTTNGTETYGGGRYLLDGAKSADLGGDAQQGTLVLDFNFAYHPSCAFDPQWVCPLVPPENRLDLRIAAGECLQQST